ncbi:hypothetical protein Dimus_023452 [Dionaea muscipula]
MAAASRRRTSGPVHRSHSPADRLYGSSYTSPASASGSAFASSTSSFSSRSSSFFQRSASPTRVTMAAPTVSSSSSSIRFSIDRSISPSRSISASPRSGSQVVRNRLPAGADGGKRTCMCSPTTHPGSFRCSLHKNSGGSPSRQAAVPYQSNRLNARRSAMTNSLMMTCEMHVAVCYCLVLHVLLISVNLCHLV